VQAIVFEVIQSEEHLLTAGDGAVSAGVGRDTDYDVVKRVRLGSVEEVNEAVGGELGV
jgi:hypothetical protein